MKLTQLIIIKDMLQKNYINLKLIKKYEGLFIINTISIIKSLLWF